MMPNSCGDFGICYRSKILITCFALPRRTSLALFRILFFHIAGGESPIVEAGEQRLMDDSKWRGRNEMFEIQGIFSLSLSPATP
ncbi:hypothetical protein CEXT_342041 [Caerostris extrusa]|uniref:Ycf15 n=1 Tax=Caerostris extrusa TaxID=172846 RepID=A0AAV4PB44_CAEEX|nr:hypothetical protein CEXT_342041 [Caerostris extrusa]